MLLLLMDGEEFPAIVDKEIGIDDGDLKELGKINDTPPGDNVLGWVIVDSVVVVPPEEFNRLFVTLAFDPPVVILITVVFGDTATVLLLLIREELLEVEVVTVPCGPDKNRLISSVLENRLGNCWKRFCKISPPPPPPRDCELVDPIVGEIDELGVEDLIIIEELLFDDGEVDTDDETVMTFEWLLLLLFNNKSEFGFKPLLLLLLDDDGEDDVELVDNVLELVRGKDCCNSGDGGGGGNVCGWVGGISRPEDVGEVDWTNDWADNADDNTEGGVPDLPTLTPPSNAAWFCNDATDGCDDWWAAWIQLLGETLWPRILLPPEIDGDEDDDWFAELAKLANDCNNARFDNWDSCWCWWWCCFCKSCCANCSAIADVWWFFMTAVEVVLLLVDDFKVDNDED